MLNKALFLDRDGTINVEKNYVFRIVDFKFRNGIFQAVKSYYDKGYLIFVVTNQSGIARGFYSEEDFRQLTQWMVGRFNEEGIIISRVYHCPHHPEITGPCPCRKPAPGMILQAIDEFKVDPAGSVLVGDKQSDIIAGRNAGIGENILIKPKGAIKF